MIKSPTIAKESRHSDKQDTAPPLQSGDRLTRAEFERRYTAHPDIKKAELIEGVVYVASPIYVRHGKPHLAVATWAGTYQAATPHIEAADNLSVRLDLENEVQPDVCLWLDEAVGGQARVPEEMFLEGAPELAIEVAVSSAAYDLHDKLHVYWRNGVQEYLVLVAHERQTLWYRLHEEKYEPLEPDQKGILKSHVFPGLWFNSAAFWEGDLAGVLKTLDDGLQSAEYATFINQVKERAEH